MESSLVSALAPYLVAWVAWVAIRVFGHVYTSESNSRKTALIAGGTYLLVGIASTWFFEADPAHLGASPQFQLIKNFFSIGVAALAANCLATALFMPTKKQEEEARRALARAVAEEIKRPHT